jgi:hypothetical protein
MQQQRLNVLPQQYYKSSEFSVIIIIFVSKILPLMKPFLHSIAEAYLANEAQQLIDYCFVFPNKRSATFFIDYLSQLSRSSGVKVVNPATTTIVDFVESFASTAPGERMEMIFTLFNVYRNVIAKHHGATQAQQIDFNRFIYWADVLLNDFDDVDNSLANPDEVFRNVETLKEISANYLDDNLRALIRAYWKDSHLEPEVQEFWNHIAYESHHTDKGNKAVASTGFLRLWQVMNEIYHQFHKQLSDANLHTSGMAFRNAAELLTANNAPQLPFARYVFVGFNNLSTAEKSIFAYFRDTINERTGQPLGDFYWDIASPAFHTNAAAELNIGAHVKSYANEFPSLYGNYIEPINKFPKIDIIGIPSRVGQGKALANIIGQLFPPIPSANGNEPSIDEEALRNTAVILPEEPMLKPMLNSLPKRIAPLNITMGYKLRNTAVAGLIRDIISMQMRSYHSKQSQTFFYEDVANILSNPLVRTYKPTTCTAILLYIQQRRLFNVPATIFNKPEFSGMEQIFRIVTNNDGAESTFRYLRELLWWLTDALVSVANSSDTNVTTNATDNDNDDNSRQHNPNIVSINASGNINLTLQTAFIKRYENAIDRLHLLCSHYLGGIDTIFIENATIFTLVERMVQGEMLNFEGVPLRGLQIIGVLEARSLDFQTLLMPSMNERIFPRAHFNTSFIPNVLRSAYNLPTSDDQEEVFAYFFYRMISRAKRVFLLYDARSSGIKSKQMSRYIHQLIHIFKPANMSMRILPYALNAPDNNELTVEKTPEIMRQINRFFESTAECAAKGVTPRFFSASAIKQYVGCPMSFYFEKIAHYQREDEFNDWMDEGTLGSVIHKVFEMLFQPYIGKTITQSTLTSLRNNTVVLNQHICKAVNEIYFKKDLTQEAAIPLTGETAIIGNMILDYVTTELEREKKYAPFTYIGGELDKMMEGLELKGSGDNAIKLNLRVIIDRIDSTSTIARADYPQKSSVDETATFNRIRIVDYKTGSDSITTPSLLKIFHDYDKKAFLQVMLYAQAYKQLTHYNGPIEPLIVSLRKLMIQPLSHIIGPEPAKGIGVAHAELKKCGENRSGWYILDYRDYVTEFNDMLIEILKDLRRPDIPFKCADNDSACHYCAFKAVCRRENSQHSK